MNIDENLIKLSGKSFLSISDLNSEQINDLINLAALLKNKSVQYNYPKKVLGLIFEKSSTRTRVSFQVAMNRLSGNTIEISPSNTQIGRGESIKDTVRVLSNYVDALAIRTFEQDILDEYEKWGNIPVINALTDLEHPCQILADFLTIKEEFGSFDGVEVSYFGDGNNIANSLILCGAILGVQINIACPAEFKPNDQIIKKSLSFNNGNKVVRITQDPYQAAKRANVIYTDVWASMGQELQAEKKEKLFHNFSVNKELVSHAAHDHIILHCLPAYRGKEITDEIIESSSSRIFKQSENRLHVQQALLASIFS